MTKTLNSYGLSGLDGGTLREMNSRYADEMQLSMVDVSRSGVTVSSPENIEIILDDEKASVKTKKLNCNVDDIDCQRH